MQPSTKPQRTDQQIHEEKRTWTQHDSDPIRESQFGTVCQAIFMAILNLMRRLKQIREEQSLSRTEVAKRMELTEFELSQLENGKDWNPSVSLLHKWAEAVGRKLEIKVSEELKG